MKKTLLALFILLSAVGYSQNTQVVYTTVLHGDTAFQVKITNTIVQDSVIRYTYSSHAEGGLLVLDTIPYMYNFYTITNTVRDSIQINKLTTSQLNNTANFINPPALATNIKTINGASLLGSGDLAVVGSGAAWGTITGTLSSQTDLQTALDGKVPTTRTVNGQALSANITIPGSAITAIPQSSVTNYAGYTINVQALTGSPADITTYYFGMLPKAPVTAANTSKVYIRQAGTITGAEIYTYAGTAGTNESWSIYIRVNNTTDYLIAAVGAATSERVFSNTGLSISVNAGDYFEIKSITPTWATNPLTLIYGGYVRIN